MYIYIYSVSCLDPRRPPAANLLPRQQGYTQQSQCKHVLDIGGWDNFRENHHRFSIVMGTKMIGLSWTILHNTTKMDDNLGVHDYGKPHTPMTTWDSEGWFWMRMSSNGFSLKSSCYCGSCYKWWLKLRLSFLWLEFKQQTWDQNTSFIG